MRATTKARLRRAKKGLLWVALLLLSQIIPVSSSDNQSQLGVAICFDLPHEERNAIDPAGELYFSRIQDPLVQARARAEVLKALAAYTSETVANLKKVLIVHTLRGNDAIYSGTYVLATRTIIVSIEAVQSGYGWSDFRAAVHHELSGILLNLFSETFPRHQWLQLNAPDSRYLGGGYAAIKSGRYDLRLNETLMDKGFLCPYGTASLEEDVNTFAEYVMSGDSAFAAAAKHHPRIAAKASLLRQFYKNVSNSAPRPENGYP